MLPKRGAFSKIDERSSVPKRVVKPEEEIYTKEELARFQEKRQEWRKKDSVTAIAKRDQAMAVKEDLSAFGTTYAKSNPKTKWKDNDETNVKIKAEWDYKPAPVPRQFQTKEFTKRAIARMRLGKEKKEKLEPFSLSKRKAKLVDDKGKKGEAAVGLKLTASGSIEMPTMEARAKLSERKMTQRLRKANLLREMEKRQELDEREAKYRKHMPAHLLKAQLQLVEEERQARNHYSLLHRSRKQQRADLERAFQEKMAIYKELTSRQERLDNEEWEQDGVALDETGLYSTEHVFSGAAGARQAAETRMRTMSDTMIPFGGGDEWNLEAVTEGVGGGKEDEQGGTEIVQGEQEPTREPEPQSETEEHFVGDPEKRGMLWKRDEGGGGKATWQELFMYVVDDFFYTQESKSDLMPSGLLSLTDCTVRTLPVPSVAVPTSEQPTPFAFEIVTDKDDGLLNMPVAVWTLTASSQEDRDEWIAAITAASGKKMRRPTFFI